MEMRKLPCVYMRGGTSKAVMFHKHDLPDDESLWPEIFMKVMGTPDVKQIDGMGGTVSSTSKIAVISRSQREDADVDYHFFQVDIKNPKVSDNLNCGNISSAVGPFAIDEGLVKAIEPETVVRIYNTNTQKIIESHVQVENGGYQPYGSETIKGVPGTGSRIDLFFKDPGGAVTGSVFPTGLRREVFEVPDFGPVEASVVDISNAAVFVRAADVGMKGTELTEINSNSELLERLERIRCMAAVKFGLADNWEEARVNCAATPKIAIVSPPQDYTDMDGNRASREDMDLCCRMISLGVMHKAYPMTYAIATAAAALLEGTIVHDMLAKDKQGPVIRLGHASGCTSVTVCMNGGEVEKAGIVRTARRIMDGYVYIK